MRTPNSPLFKRSEIFLGLTFAALAAVAAALKLIY
jgi:hypothetical protein